MDLPALVAAWRALREDRAAPAQRFRTLAERILATGEPLLGFDVAATGLERHPGDLRLRQLQALALARSGASQRAQAELSALRAEGFDDEETLSLLARTFKDLGQSGPPALRRARLEKALATYLESYRRRGGYYAGINAATLAQVLGRGVRARSLARRVRAACLRRLGRAPRRSPERYWLHATLGEAALILGEPGQAAAQYARAAAAGRGRYADLSSTRRQASLLLRAAGMDEAPIAALRVPRIVVFSGHMIDRRGRRGARFPRRLEPWVRSELRERLRGLDAGIGYSSAACGADILFLEEMLRRGAEVRVVLPAPPEAFRHDSVDAAGAGWGRRFDAVLARAAEVQVANPFSSSSGPLDYEYANLLLDGAARLRAQALGAGLAGLAVWDGRPGDGPGGTAAQVRHWRSRGLPVEVIGLGPGAPPRPARAGAAPRPRAKRRLMAILFADAVGFSKLREEQVPAFNEKFLAAAAPKARSGGGPILRNTWGDALYLVFPDLSDAARYALELGEKVSSVDWTRHGLPRGMSFRIALHAGPVFETRDPVTGRRAFVGAHVSGAARIEPVAPPGQVFASQAFAALAAAQGARGFRCDYVGRVPLAKHYGTFPLYHLTRSAPR